MTRKKKASQSEAGERETKSLAEHLRVPAAAPYMRVGLLGGSFDPAHAAHRQISLTGLKRLGLDQVWWLVSPGNPLKGDSKPPDLGARVAAARAIASHPRIVVTGFEGARVEAAKGSAYTIDTIRFLKRRFPSVHFVWLMGADNLAGFHHWRDWQDLFKRVPIAVLDRPGFRLKATASKAAHRFAAAAIDESDARGLALLEPPAWTLVTHPLSGLSSTSLRRGKGTKTSGAKAREGAKSRKKVDKRANKAAKRSKKKAKQH